MLISMITEKVKLLLWEELRSVITVVKHLTLAMNIHKSISTSITREPESLSNGTSKGTLINLTQWALLTCKVTPTLAIRIDQTTLNSLEKSLKVWIVITLTKVTTGAVLHQHLKKLSITKSMVSLVTSILKTSSTTWVAQSAGER